MTAEAMAPVAKNLKKKKEEEVDDLVWFFSCFIFILVRRRQAAQGRTRHARRETRRNIIKAKFNWKESKVELYKPALESMRGLLRSATSSMTSVPKPLKFLRPHFQTLVDCHVRWPENDARRFLADILSVLAMTYGAEGKRESLAYRFQGALEPVDCWGHEFCRHLSAEIIAAYNDPVESTTVTPEGLNKLALELVPFFLKHNAEADACDLMLEMEIINKLTEFVDKDTYARVCVYIVGCIPYVSPPDDIAIMRTAHAIYSKFGRHADALQLAIKLRDNSLIWTDMESCTDK